MGPTRNYLSMSHPGVRLEVTILVVFAYTPQVYFCMIFRDYWVISDLGIIASRNKSLHPWSSYRESSKSLLWKAMKGRCSLFCTLCTISEGYNWNKSLCRNTAGNEWGWGLQREVKNIITLMFSSERNTLWIFI